MEIKDILGELKSTREALAAKIGERDGQIKKNGEAQEKTAGEVKNLFERMERMNSEVNEKLLSLGRPDLSGEREASRKSVGAQFVESEAYKRASSTGLKTTDSVDVKAMDLVGRKAAITSETTGGNLLGETQRDRTMVVPTEEMLRLRDIMNTRSTNVGKIDYVEEVSFTNNAAPVAEGALKPESAFNFELREATAKTIAHGVPATNQVLADADQLQDHIDTRLRYGLRVVEERQILYGSGAGANLPGLLTHANRQTYAWSAGKAGDTKIDALRRAMTKVRLAEFPVEGIALHPSDWEDIELEKGSDDRYLIASYNQGGEMRFFRVPAVDTTALQVGQAAVGAFRLAATLYTREEANVRVFEQHQDFAARNMVYIRAELRDLLVNYRPQAFVHVTFDAAPAAA